MNWRKLLQKTIENWPAKALSIVLAIGLFLFHWFSGLEERFFSAPLILEMNESLAVANSYPRMIRVRLRGDANSIYPILDDDIEVYVDLMANTEPGNYRAPVKVRRKGTAVGIDTLEISVDPVEIPFELDTKISKPVPLTPALQGFVKDGYELSYTLSPTQVTVDGPERVMEGISDLSTSMIDLTDRSEDFSVNLQIMNRDPLIVLRGDGMTEFRGYILPKIRIKTYNDLPIRLTGLRQGFTAVAQFDRGTVKLEGIQNDLDVYIPGPAMLTLDCSQISRPGRYPVPVTANVPPSFTLNHIDPSEIMVTVTQINGRSVNNGSEEGEAEAENPEAPSEGDAQQ
ncbi:hypothetical protein FACS1894151_08280 [Spirochaetia bacterium]|nr:hypothetical protein FACS1894151_08280 [Spirochaetia bacterium]